MGRNKHKGRTAPWPGARNWELRAGLSQGKGQSLVTEMFLRNMFDTTHHPQHPILSFTSTSHTVKGWSSVWSAFRLGLPGEILRSRPGRSPGGGIAAGQLL
jgi:hypothetical protein